MLPPDDQVRASEVVLRLLGQLPASLTRGLWRHADNCPLSQNRTCQQVRGLLRDHLRAALAAADDWEPSWNAETALFTILDVRRLPKILHIFTT